MSTPASTASAGGRPAPARTVGEASEAELLDLIQDALAPVARDAPWPAGTVPPGDDCAVVPAPRGLVAVSTDAMGEGTDFLRRWPAGVRTRGHDVGWKAAAQNLSDVNAMGATPSALVTALALPAPTPLDWVASLAGGFTAAVRALGADRCRVAGGDLGAGESVQVAVTALGDPDPAGALRRAAGGERGAKIARRGADLVLAAGSPRAAAAGEGQDSAWGPAGPGWAAAGLALLLTDRAVLTRRWADLAAHERPSARELARAVRGQLRPRPPLAAGPAAARAGLAALMDVSDGLGRDGHRLARASSAPGAPLVPWVDRRWLAEAAEPLRRVASLAGTTPEALVLGGAEDYGLLGLAEPGLALPSGFRRVGRLAPAGETPDGHVRLPEAGWDHFDAGRG